MQHGFQKRCSSIFKRLNDMCHENEVLTCYQSHAQNSSKIEDTDMEVKLYQGSKNHLSQIPFIWLRHYRHATM